MTVCPQTSLSIPECSCARCIERQLAEFAPRSGPHSLDDGETEGSAAFAPEREAAA